VRVRFADVGGVRTRYYDSDTGDLEPMILVHGGGALADTWIRNIEALGEVRRVFAPDLLGHGFTDLPDGLSDRPPQVVQKEHIVRFADALGLDRFVLAGHSFGGLVAALAYLDDRERFTKLVLVASSSVFQRGGSHRGAVSGAQQNQLPALEDPTPEKIRKRNVGSNYDGADPFEELIVLQMTALAMPGRLEAFKWVSKGLEESADSADLRVFSRLEDFKVPTLVIAGRNDPRCSIESIEEGVARMPDAVLHVIDRCGHKPFSEHSEVFNGLVTTFLSAPEEDPG
jgi:2-hydroxy-6-oxonona-2,4-dienedioate hydrolase